jgi:hypothetical protein
MEFPSMNLCVGGRGRRTRGAALLVAVLWMAASCAHSQRPERKTYVVSEDARGVGTAEGAGTGGSGSEAYCAEIQKQCFQACWSRKPAITSIPKHSAVHHEYCTSECLDVFMKCVAEQEALEQQDSKRERSFSTMTAALDWLREHKSEVVLGSIIVVAGVSFTLAVAPAGLLILSPI